MVVHRCCKFRWSAHSTSRAKPSPVHTKKRARSVRMMLLICQFICSFSLFSAQRSEHETTYLAVNLQPSKIVDRFWSHVCRPQWLSCSLFALSAHSWPEKLLTLRAYYHRFSMLLCCFLQYHLKWLVKRLHIALSYFF